MDEARAVFIDALNVAHWCGRDADLRLPLALLADLLGKGVHAELYFDASAPHRLGGAGACYETLRQRLPCLVQVPAGRRADGELLRQARMRGARIVSRDRFRDYRARFRRLIDDPQRLIDGWVAQDVLHVPALDVAAPLPAGITAAADAVLRLAGKARG